MSRNPLNIVNEFLRSPEAQIRSNAVTALAVIDSDESIAELVKAAQSDTTASVRKHAEDELLGLTGDSAARAIKVLHAALDDAQKQMPTYVLLGRLRSRGFSVTMPAWGMLRRLRLVWAMRLYLYPTPTWAFRMRTLWPALLGGILGAFLFGGFCAMTMGLDSVSDFFAGIFFAGLLLPPLTGIVVSKRSSSINLYVDRVMAGLVEIGITVLWSCFLAVLFTVVLSLEEVRQSGGAFVITVLGIGASVGAIRGGTLLAFGSFAHRRWNLYAQVAVGVASGVGVITALFVISGVFPEPLPAGAWAVLLSTSVGIARACASIDMESPPVGPIAGRVARPLSLLLVFSLVLAILAFAIPTVLFLFPASAESGTRRLLTVPSTGSSATKHFKVRFPQRIKAVIPEGVQLYTKWKPLQEEIDKQPKEKRLLNPEQVKQLRQAEGFRSYKLELWNYGWVGKNKIVEPSSEKNKIVELSSETPPPEIFREQNLPCGDYWINAKSSDRTARLTLVKILPLLVARVSSVLPYSQANDTSIKRFTLELTLNSEAESSRGCDRAIPNSTVE